MGNAYIYSMAIPPYQPLHSPSVVNGIRWFSHYGTTLILNISNEIRRWIINKI